MTAKAGIDPQSGSTDALPTAELEGADRGVSPRQSCRLGAIPQSQRESTVKSVDLDRRGAWRVQACSWVIGRVRSRSPGSGRVAVNGGNEEQVGTGPLLGARGGERFALALISLALDEVDAAVGAALASPVRDGCAARSRCECRRFRGNAGANRAKAIVSREPDSGRPGPALRRRCARAPGPA